VGGGVSKSVKRKSDYFLTSHVGYIMIKGSFYAQSVVCIKELLQRFTGVTVLFIPDGYRKIFVNKPHSNPPEFR